MITFERVKYYELDDKPKAYRHKIPGVKPISVTTGLAVFAGITLIGASIGAAIGTYVFFGVATLTGLVVLIESNKYLRYVAMKSNKLIDIAIFGATVYATASLGITISAALVFCGLGYTLVYSPYLRSVKSNNKFDYSL